MKKLLITLICIMFFGVVAACGTDDATSSDYDELANNLSEAFGTTVYVPVHEDYPIGMAYIQYDTAPDGNDPTEGEAKQFVETFLNQIQ